jgi:hypothetical protein
MTTGRINQVTLVNKENHTEEPKRRPSCTQLLTRHCSSFEGTTDQEVLFELIDQSQLLERDHIDRI